MENKSNRLSELVIELVELSRFDSPYTSDLLKQHRKKVVDSLVSTNQIDHQTADYLLE